MKIADDVNFMHANESKFKRNCITNSFTDSHCLAKLCGESIALNNANCPLSYFKIYNYV